MGWKASCIFVNEGGGDLSSLPSHDPSRALEILNQLKLTNYVRVEMDTFENGIYPGRDLLYLGAYPGSFLLCHEGIASEFFLDVASDGQHKEPKTKIARQLNHFTKNVIGFKEKQHEELRGWVRLFLTLFPSAHIDVVILASSVNLWGYACFQSGKRIRTRTGNAMNGTIVEFGERQPFEEELFAKAIIKDGKRLFTFDTTNKKLELSDDQIGEEFVFRLIEQWFGGKPIFGPAASLFDAFELEMEVFREQ